MSKRLSKNNQIPSVSWVFYNISFLYPLLFKYRMVKITTRKKTLGIYRCPIPLRHDLFVEDLSEFGGRGRKKDGKIGQAGRVDAGHIAGQQHTPRVTNVSFFPPPVFSIPPHVPIRPTTEKFSCLRLWLLATFSQLNH